MSSRPLPTSMSRRDRRALAIAIVAALAVAAHPKAARAIPAPPTFSPEHDLTVPVLAGATGEQTAPQGAWNGNQLLVTWRSSAWRNELRAGRVAADGTALDPRGVALGPIDRGDATAAVAAGGDDFLIAWTRDPGQVVTTAIRGTGPIEIPPPTLVTSGEADGSTGDPALGWNGQGYWVAYTRGVATTTLWAQRLGPDGHALDPTPLALGTAARQPPALATMGTRTLLVWTTSDAGATELRGVRLEADGRLLDPTPIVLAKLAGDVPGPVSAIAHGIGFVVAGAGLHGGAFADMRLVRMTADGVPDAGVAMPLIPGTARGGPTLVDGGLTVQALWSIGVPEGPRQVPQLQGMRVDDSGVGSAPVLPPGISQGELPSLVQANGDPFLLWGELTRFTDDGMTVDIDVRSVRLGATAGASPGTPPTPGTMASPSRLSQAPSWQSDPAVAWSGQRLLLAFTDARGDKAGGDVFATRLDEQGQPLDGSGLALGTGPTPQHAPAVAWDGSQFVVVWHEGDHGLAIARVSEAGAVLDPFPLLVPGTDAQALLSEPALCADGDGVLLLWGARHAAVTPGAPATREAELRGLRIPHGATITGASSFLLTSTSDADLPPTIRVGCNDGAALVVWDGVLAPDEPSRLHMARLLRGAQVFDRTTGLLTVPGQNAGELAGIASDGHGFLAAWRAFNPTGQRTVYAARIDGSGSLLDDPRGFTVGLSNSGRRVTALWDGRQYLVFAVNTDGGNPFEWRARRIDSTGAVVDRDWITAAVLSKPWGGGGAGGDGVVIGPGKSFLTYEQYAEDDAASNPRARGRFMDSTLPLAVDGGMDAASGSEDAGVSDGSDAGPGANNDDGCGCDLGGSRELSQGMSVATAAMAFVVMVLRKRRGRIAPR